MSSLEDSVKKELEDPAFSNRRHGTRPCYRAGCRGPLCKRFIRLQRREYRGTGPGYHEELDKMLEPYQQAHDSTFEVREVRDNVRAS